MKKLIPAGLMVLVTAAALLARTPAHPQMVTTRALSPAVAVEHVPAPSVTTAPTVTTEAPAAVAVWQQAPARPAPVVVEPAPVPVDEPTTTTTVAPAPDYGMCGPLPCCPPVTYDGDPNGPGPQWQTPDGKPPSYDCNGPGYRELPSSSSSEAPTP